MLGKQSSMTKGKLKIGQARGGKKVVYFCSEANVNLDTFCISAIDHTFSAFEDSKTFQEDLLFLFNSLYEIEVLYICFLLFPNWKLLNSQGCFED